LVAYAASASAAEDKAKAAKKACISGDYAKGVELLSDLYVETNDLNYVFNQGRCFEQNGRYQDAINRFREYARKLKAEGRPADSEVERHIADCQAMLAREATPSPAHPEPLPPVPVAMPASAPQVQVAQAAPKAGSPGAGLRIGGLVAMGVGVAALATGVVLNVKANQLTDDLERSDLSYSRDKDATRSSYKTWGWVSYGVGAAGLVGGAVLYFVGRSQARSDQPALVPMAGPDRVGAALQGAF
jgi:hypothetical protein